MKSILCMVTGLAASGLALPSALEHVVHESRDHSATLGLTKRGAADKTTEIPVRIALKQQNIENGDHLLREVSDIHSPKYGQHYTPEQVTELFAPSSASVDKVTAWLASAGVPASSIKVSKGRGFVSFDAPVAQVEHLLRARYHLYTGLATRAEHIGTDEYSLPADVAPHVDFVLPAVALGQVLAKTPVEKRGGGEDPGSLANQFAIKEPPRPLTSQQQLAVAANKSIEEDLSVCGYILTPACIAAKYGIPKAELSNATNPLGMFEALGDVYSQEDLDAFFALAAPHIPEGTKPSLALINGATAPVAQKNAGPESDLDFQMAYPIVYPQKILLYQVESRTDIFLSFLDAIDGDFCQVDEFRNPSDMCGVFPTTSVISVSYGGSEYQFNTRALTRQCNEFMKLGLQGVTVVIASGDSGIASRSGLCLGPHHDIFVPDNPSGCPYITAVGSTELPHGASIKDAEVATTGFSSGGGFSNVFDRPWWQEDAVSEYLLRHNPNYYSYNTTGGKIPDDTDGIYNRNGRAYPDVAAFGDNGLAVVRGEPTAVGGTSMAAPIVAAIINRINEERLNLGKGPVGFINPALYQGQSRGYDLFNDVTVGDQRLGGAYGDRYPSACGNNGFSATPGWDPVTGYGTPRYQKLLEYFKEL